MKYCLILAVFSSLAIHPLAAQTPCAGQLIPLRPTFLFCPNAAPACVGSTNGFGGHWVWGCPTASTSGVQSAPDPPAPYVPIPLMVNQQPLKTPAEMMIETQRLRQLRLQNEIQQQQLDEMRRANAAREAEARQPVEPSVEPAAPKPAETSKLAERQTNGQWNGRFWKAMPDTSKLLYVIAYEDAAQWISFLMTPGTDGPPADKVKLWWPVSLSYDDTAATVDRFYENPENVAIPIRYALVIVAERSAGVGEDQIQKLTLDFRQIPNK